MSCEKFDGNEIYSYNRKNQLVSRKKAGESVSYRYSPQGNVEEETGENGTTRYAYNLFNRQSEVRTAKGAVLESLYDGEGLRAGTIQDGKKSTFVYFNGELLAEEREQEETIDRLILGYGVAASELGGGKGYHAYHLDERISTGFITNSQQQVENSYSYDAFGNVGAVSEGIANRIMYTGQQYDQATNQYYLRARCYNPVVGRFMQEDEYHGDGLNLYAYCANNPVTYYNPSGYIRKKPAPNPNIDYGTINSHGQRSGIIAQTTPQMTGKGSPANQNIRPPGFINGKSPSSGGEGQARAHLLGNQLGGSGDVESNLVTFLQNPTNNSDMRKVENQVRAYVDKNQEDVYYMVTPLYDGNSEKPYGVRMEAVSVNGDNLYLTEDKIHEKISKYFGYHNDFIFDDSLLII